MVKNPPIKSKINYLGLVIAVIGVASYYGWVPRGVENYMAEIVMVVGGPIIMVCRTWFN